MRFRPENSELMKQGRYGIDRVDTDRMAAGTGIGTTAPA